MEEREREKKSGKYKLKSVVTDHENKIDNNKLVKLCEWRSWHVFTF